MVRVIVVAQLSVLKALVRVLRRALEEEVQTGSQSSCNENVTHEVTMIDGSG